MSTHVEVDISKLEECFSDANIKRAGMAYIEAAASDSNNYVPYLTGSLHGSMTITDEGMEWRQAYAQAVYYRDDEATNWTQAGKTEPHSFWFEWAKAKHGEDWVKALVRTLLKPLGKGNGTW